ncbi:MAG: thiazole synthase, partial [Candidatus Omnitrophota bacterium]
MGDGVLRIGNKEFKSRLLVGTGKYAAFDIMEKALEASGAEVVTV